MSVHRIASADDYVRFARTHPAETDLLFKELLIGVTSMFRDPDVFTALGERWLPELLAARPDDLLLRVWVAGCSTGEEAYSLAIVLEECLERLERHTPYQIFATDLDSRAIEVARAGVYPEGIVGDVSSARLERFFVREQGRYRIRKELRENLVFADQNLIGDPPFTKLDLLSCRNVLIYLRADIQRRLLPLFHYSLRPGGVLLLGSSEAIGTFGNLFEALDKKLKIFRRREVPAGSYVAELSPSGSPASVSEPVSGPLTTHARTPLAQLAEQAVVRELIPPSVIIRERGDIVHVHGRTGAMLEPAPGSPASANIFNMAREGLHIPLAAALRQASRTAEPAMHRNVRVKTNGESKLVDLQVRRLTQPEPLSGLFVVSFEHLRALATHTADEASTVEDLSSDHLQELERELRHTRDYHQGTVEELEITNEELESTNEELQSTNEELQSANEELETSKEEMQSLNEELQTVNAELLSKVEELSRANDDMRNLLNGTDIATIFLGNELEIKRYTDRAKNVISLIPGDIGRPLADLASKLEFDGLIADVTEVLATLVPKEREVRSESGTWYLMRVLPYRTTENVIEGLVITFAETTRIKRLEQTAAQLQRVLAHSPTTVLGQDAKLRFTWGYGPTFGRSIAELLGKTDPDIFGPEQGARLVALKRRVLASGVPLRERIELTVDGDKRCYYICVEPMLVDDGTIGIASIVTDLGSEWERGS